MIRIHRATPNDLDALLPLLASYRTFYQQSADVKREREFLARHLQSGTSTIYLARDHEGEAVGFVQLFPTYSSVRLGPSLVLEDLFVAPRARRRGVATQLLERAVEHAREIGAVGMSLETATTNAAAQAAYERLGWTRESAFYKYNSPPLH